MSHPDWRRRPFWTNVLMTDTCWLWTGGKSEWGYGRLTELQGERTGEQRAHRHSFVLFYGAIPEGLQINHHCDVPACVRPDHLYAGTAKENTRDALLRNRGIGRKRRDICPRGHVKEGIRTDKGYLRCLICKRDQRRAIDRARNGIPPERWRKP